MIRDGKGSLLYSDSFDLITYSYALVMLFSCLHSRLRMLQLLQQYLFFPIRNSYLVHFWRYHFHTKLVYLV